MNNLKNVKCLICGYETNNHQSFNSHISHGHHIKSKEYYDTYIKKENECICLTCGKPTAFIDMWKGYRTYCCNSCMSSSKEIQEKRKQTSLQHYGTEFPHQAQEVKDKMINTCLAKYGAINVYASEYGKQKIKETCQNKYNTNNPAQAQEVKEKMANTCLAKYGTTCPLANEEIKNKIKQTCKNKHGVNWTSQIPESREKTKQTNKKRYGKEYIFQLEYVREKTAKTAYTHEARSKAAKTRRLKGNRSKLEDFLEDFFINNHIKYKTEYNKDNRYPYFCDFYLPYTDTFIEINGYWTHGGHWFDKNNLDDLQLLEKWNFKNTPQYKRAIYVWTISDIEKRNVAIKNGLNYIVLWNKQDIINYINSFNK